jgi:predicted O-methyltransferase YrrM
MKGERSWIPGQVDLDWIESIAAPIAPALRAIEVAAEPLGVPIVDRHAGRVLSVLAGDRRRIVEVGTAYGYSTLWMALGQPTDGTIVTIDPDAERTDLARGWWRDAGIADPRIIQVSAPALDAFAAADPELDGPFDLAFIDALKHEYADYLAALVDGGRLVPGALVVADNVLWSGLVSAPNTADSESAAASDRSTTALRAFCEGVSADPRFTTSVLPVGDGLLVATWHGPARAG